MRWAGLLALPLLLAASETAHPGALDARGCHRERRGVRHCHPERAHGPGPAGRPLPGARFSGRVSAVLDGDTVEVLREGRAVRVRLAGIDCPEKRQPFGARAKRFTSASVFGRDVSVLAAGADRYGRLVGEVLLSDGRSLNRELVKAGLAWWYRNYSKDPSLADLEAEARRARRGLWSDPWPVEPWSFRRKGAGV